VRACEHIPPKMSNSSTAYFIDLSEQRRGILNGTKNVNARPEPTNLLTVRQPGTPTKRGINVASAGEENKTQLSNQLGFAAEDGALKVKSMNVVQNKVQLPLRLQKRLASLPGRPTAEHILQKEEQVEMKREEMIKAKVQGAAQYGAKVQEVRARKNEFDKNISGGACSDENASAICGKMTTGSCCHPSEPIKLPKRLAKRLRDLEAISAARAVPILDKEAQVEARRQAQLDAVKEKQASHLATVNARMAAKASERRYEEVPEFLPEHLKVRLENFRRPTKEAILRRETMAASRKQILLDSKIAEAKCHSVTVNHVRSARDAFVANEVDFGTSAKGPEPVLLPKRLAKRVQELAPKWTPESILGANDRVSARRAELISAKQAKVRTHLARVAKLCENKTTEPRFSELPQQQQESGADSGTVAILPDRLRARLANIKRSTKETILRKETLALNRAKMHIESKAQVARAHNIVNVPRARALKQSIVNNDIILATSAEISHATPISLPKRLAKRLELLRARSMTWTPEKQYAKEEAAAQKRHDMLEGVVAAAAEHGTKVEKLSANKRFEARFGNNRIPSGLPEKLRTRLEGIQRRTPEAILRKNELAAVRRAAAIAQRAHVAHLHNDAAKTAVALKQSMVQTGMVLPTSAPISTPLPKHLQDRLARLTPSWTPERLIAKEEHAADVRRGLMKTVSAKAMAHNKLAADRLARKTREPRFTDEVIAPFLPAQLRSRLSSLSKPKAETIRRKLAQAVARHALVVEAIRFRATIAQCRGSAARELKKSLVDNEVVLVTKAPEQVKLPNRLAKRAEALAPKWTSEALLAREKDAGLKRSSMLKSVQKSARLHGCKVKARQLAKETELRFPDGAPAGIELPEHLAKRLAELRKPTNEAIKKRLEMAATRSRLFNATKSHKAMMHLQHADDVRKTHNMYRDSMEILTKGATKPVSLPKHLRKRLAEVEAAKPTAESLLAKEVATGARRAGILATRSAKLAEHATKVQEVRKLLKTKPRYDESEIANNAQLPDRLKERLKAYRSPTEEAMQGKQARAQQRRVSMLEAKSRSAHSHQAYVAQVKALKQQFVENQVSFVPDERDESPSLPPSLQQKLKMRSPRSAEEIMMHESAVSNQRDALLNERVQARQQHSQKVEQVLQKHKAQAAKPETD